MLSSKVDGGYQVDTVVALPNTSAEVVTATLVVDERLQATSLILVGIRMFQFDSPFGVD